MSSDWLVILILLSSDWSGVLYHGIVLGGDSTSVHVYERVELELGVVASDNVWTSHLSLVSTDTGHGEF